MFFAKKIDIRAHSLQHAIDLKKNKSAISQTTLQKLLIMLYADVAKINALKIDYGKNKQVASVFDARLTSVVEAGMSHILESSIRVNSIKGSTKNLLLSIVFSQYRKNTLRNAKAALLEQNNYNNDSRRKEFVVLLDQCIQKNERDINTLMHSFILTFRYLRLHGEIVELSAATAIYGSLETVITDKIQRIVDELIAKDMFKSEIGKVEANMPIDIIKTKLYKIFHPDSKIKELQNEMALLDQVMDYARESGLEVGQEVTFYQYDAPDGTTDYYTKNECIKNKIEMNRPIKATVLNENDYNLKSKALSEKYQRLQSTASV
ncbi:hypothetical protein L2X78_08345 [Enterobacter mori]|uniref:hypothetical protein n=1 Tax=Enterobacter mori TaxID=539813 RepID=UPI001EE4E7BB|nr:hypothetical protein [Enterobacter mori]MCG5127589.1 hypothetical protein [Enterobacter mori]